MNGKCYKFEGRLWLYPGQAGWHFVSLSSELATRIRFLHPRERKAWGSIKVTATIGKTTWQTSLFSDQKSGTYLLPVKAEVRKLEGLKPDMNVSVCVELPEQELP